MAVVCCQLLQIFIAFTELIFHGSEAAFKTVPQNEIALYGDDVEFQCSTDSSEPLSWSVTYASETTSNVLYIYGNLTSFGEMLCRIDTSIRGQYNLIVNSVEIYHAGKYRCSEGSLGTEVEADLAVIDPEPFCHQFGDTSVVETGHLVMECKLWFAGEVDSFTEWFKNGSVVDPAMVQISIYSFTIKSTLRQHVNSSDNGADIIFKTTFRQRNNSREIGITWNFTVSVIYGPKNINIEPKSLTYNIGDSLKCSADGNPTPSYEWALIGNETKAKRVTDGPVLIIDKTMITNKQLHFQCTAINNVTGERKSISKSITFTVTAWPFEIKTLIKTVLVVGILLCCCIIISVVIGVKAHQKRTSESPENVRERRNTLSASDVDHQPHEETIGRHQSSQQDQVIGHSLANERNYAELSKPSTVNQQEIYSQLHIYGNASTHAEYYMNQSDIELEQISPDYLDIDSVEHLQSI